MKTYLDCIPCLLKQGINAARLCQLSAQKEEQLMREMLGVLHSSPFLNSPPVLAREIYHLVRNVSGKNDPYEEIKKQYNHEMLAILPELKNEITGGNHFQRAVKMAITGNIIDFGALADLSHERVLQQVRQLSETTLAINHCEVLEKTLMKAGRLLYLADNCGEIVFDRVFLEYLKGCFPQLSIQLVLRGGPVINDATRADIKGMGFENICKIMDSGDDTPGTVLERCSVALQRKFATADVVIAKGQGNFEGLCDTPKDNLFFLFMAKCDVVADKLQIPKMSLVCQQGEKEGKR